MSDLGKICYLTSFCSHRNGGIAVALQSLVSEIINEPRFSLEVLCAADRQLKEDRSWWAGLPISSFPIIGPESLACAPRIKAYLSQEKPRLTHLHGLWTAVSWHDWRSAANGTPNVISPHGMLDAWALNNSRWKKKIFGAAFEARHIRNASCISALCAPEANSVRSFGYRGPVAVVPNGVELPNEEKLRDPKRRPSGRKRIVFMGRIHPKKGLSNLLAGWSRALRDKPYLRDEWCLQIIGWDEGGHLSELKSQAAHEGFEENIIFSGPMFGEEKEMALLGASAFVLPSQSEGLPMSILEAWAYRLPVVMTEACNLEVGFAAGGALQVEPSVSSVQKGLLEVTAMSDADRESMGRKGRELVENQFTWARVADMYTSLYQWLLEGGEPPDFVEVR